MQRSEQRITVVELFARISSLQVLAAQKEKSYNSWPDGSCMLLDLLECHVSPRPVKRFFQDVDSF